MSTPTIVEPRPFIFRNIVVIFGATKDFAKAVSSAVLRPTSGTAEFKGGKPSAVYTFPQATTWVFDINAAQDWSTADSLSKYLFDNAGKTVPVTFNADDTSGDASLGKTVWNFDAAIAPPAIGSDIDSVAIATTSHGVVGAPVPTYTAGALADEDVPDADADDNGFIPALPDKA